MSILINILMRLSEIRPGQKEDMFSVLEDIWDSDILANCSEIIAIYKKARTFLFRGISSGAPNIFIGAPHEERKPKDSSPIMVDEFDKLLRGCGMAATRSNSIFCTSDEHGTEMYGETYILFPKNGFHSTYLPHVDDLILSRWNHLLGDELNKGIESSLKVYIDSLPDDQKPPFLGGKLTSIDVDHLGWDTVIRIISGFKSQSITLHQVIRSLKMILPDNPFIQSLDPNNLINVEDFRKKYNPQNQNLIEGMKQGAEIYISGEYYAINSNMYRYELINLMRNLPNEAQ